MSVFGFSFLGPLLQHSHCADHLLHVLWGQIRESLFYNKLQMARTILAHHFYSISVNIAQTNPNYSTMTFSKQENASLDFVHIDT